MFEYESDFDLGSCFLLFVFVSLTAFFIWAYNDQKKQADDYFLYLMTCGTSSNSVCVDTTKLECASDYGMKMMLLSKKYSELGYKVSNNGNIIVFEK